MAGGNSPGDYDLLIMRGTDYRRTFRVRTNGDLDTITAAEAANAAGLNLDPQVVDGAVEIAWTAAESLTLATGSWPWDLYLTIDGERDRYVSGTMRVEAGIAEGL